MTRLAVQNDMFSRVATTLKSMESLLANNTIHLERNKNLEKERNK